MVRSSGGLAALLFIVIATLGDANAAVVFDWPSPPGWTAGAPTPGQTATQSFTAVNPNDITVGINNSGAGPQGMVWNGTLDGGYPQINSTHYTGGFTGVNGLQLLVTSSQAAGTFMRTTITFATPVAGLTFQIWDVDATSAQFVDKISNIQALAVGGGTVGATSVTSATPGYNSITGTGLTTVVLGTASATNSTNQGTIDITFSGQITQFSFDWSNNDAGLGAQGIGIGPLTFTPVPEINPAWLSFIFCGCLAAGTTLHRRAKKRRAEMRSR